MMEKIKLIYIASLGHSGSTLLDVLLNQHSTIQGVGEFMFLDEWRRDKLLCSCGKELNHCLFWSDAIPDHISELGNVTDPSYVDNTYSIFKRILETSGSQIIVDSSKSLERVKILSADPRFEVKVIHLVRNGLAVVNSYRKAHDRPATENRKKTPAISLLRATLMWVRRNRAINDFSYTTGGSGVLRVRYEDLCTHTDEMLDSICHFADLKFESDMVLPKTSDIHNIGGSRWRFSSDKVVVKLDGKWKEEVSWGTRLLFNLLGGKMNRAYGY